MPGTRYIIIVGCLGAAKTTTVARLARAQIPKNITVGFVATRRRGNTIDIFASGDLN
jgi:flagellar biosynthesis GTPase FlhF